MPLACLYTWEHMVALQVLVCDLTMRFNTEIMESGRTSPVRGDGNRKQNQSALQICHTVIDDNYAKFKGSAAYFRWQTKKQSIWLMCKSRREKLCGHWCAWFKQHALHDEASFAKGTKCQKWDTKIPHLVRAVYVPAVTDRYGKRLKFKAYLGPKTRNEKGRIVKFRPNSLILFGGASGDRTRDLLHAMQVFSIFQYSSVRIIFHNISIGYIIFSHTHMYYSILTLTSF